jgi:hypothetical protein
MAATLLPLSGSIWEISRQIRSIGDGSISPERRTSIIEIKLAIWLAKGFNCCDTFSEV